MITNTYRDVTTGLYVFDGDLKSIWLGLPNVAIVHLKYVFEGVVFEKLRYVMKDRNGGEFLLFASQFDKDTSLKEGYCYLLIREVVDNTTRHYSVRQCTGIKI